MASRLFYRFVGFCENVADFVGERLFSSFRSKKGKISPENVKAVDLSPAVKADAGTL